MTTKHTSNVKLNSQIVYKLIWIFTIGAFAGFLIETVWRFMSTGQIEYRSSLVFGPFNIVYGFGALAMHLCLYKVHNKPKIYRFLIGFAAGTAVEYIISVVQERIFGTVSWDYTDIAFNINGRVCLWLSIVWGIMALVWIRIISPKAEKLMLSIPHSVGKKAAAIALIFFISVSLLSGAAIIRWINRSNNEPARGVVGEVIDAVFPDDYMKIIYANMIFLVD